MKYLVVKDKRKRFLAAKLQLKKLCMKALFLEEYFFKKFYKLKKKPNFLKFYKFNIISKIGRNFRFGSLVIVKNRCKITGRSQSILRYYRISRIVFREMSSYGQILGLKKSSW